MKRIALMLFVPGIAATLAVLGFTAAGAGPKEGFGDHSLEGLYAFSADGVVEIDGVPTQGFWEVGTLEMDGEGNLTGVERSTLLSSSDESLIDLAFTITGTYQVNSDGTGTADVSVVLPNGAEITKKVWLAIHSVGKQGIANGFDFGHADADLGGGAHGNTRTHVAHRIQIAK